MSALRLQADGIRGGEEFDLSPVWPFFFSLCTEAWSEAADDGRNASPGDFLLDLWPARGFLEAANEFSRRVFRV
jgi:hypothetical protein